MGFTLSDHVMLHGCFKLLHMHTRFGYSARYLKATLHDMHTHTGNASPGSLDFEQSPIILHPFLSGGIKKKVAETLDHFLAELDIQYLAVQQETSLSVPKIEVRKTEVSLFRL